MKSTLFPLKLAMAMIILAAAGTVSGCFTTNVDCGEGVGGAGGCWTKSYVGQSVNGQPCTSGSVCRFPGNACDMSNPNAKCTNSISNGVCSCPCL